MGFPITIIRARLADTRLPELPVRANILKAFDQMSRSGRYIRHPKAPWGDTPWSLADTGTIRIFTRVTEGLGRDARWGELNSPSIGELGYAETDDGVRHAVWRPALGYGIGGKADDNQPWRRASDIKLAYGHLIDYAASAVTHGAMQGSFIRHLLETTCIKPITAQNMSDEWLCHRNLTGETFGEDTRPAPDTELCIHNGISLQMQANAEHIAAVTRHPNVDTWVDNEGARRPFYDHELQQFVPAKAVHIGRKWSAVVKGTDTSYGSVFAANDGLDIQSTYITPDYGRGLKPDMNQRISGKQFIIYTRPQAREIALRFGRHVPKYVREALIETHGTIQEVPNRRLYPDSHRRAVDNTKAGYADLLGPGMANTQILRSMACRIAEAPTAFLEIWNSISSPFGRV